MNKDELNKILQSKFENWSIPVDESNWNEMRNKIDRARRVKSRIRFAAVGSVCILLLCFGVFVSNKNKQTIKPIVVSGIVKENVISVQNIEKQVVHKNIVNKHIDSAAPISKSEQKSDTIVPILIKNTVVAPIINDSLYVSFISDVQKGCSPITVQFKDLTKKAISWIWNFGDGNTSSEENPVHCYHNAGNYDVRLFVVFYNGDTTSLFIQNMIVAYSRPKANFTTVVSGNSVQFKDISIGASAWVWTFSDVSDVINTENISRVYQDTGSYYAHLVVTNIHGCSDTISNCVNISPIFNLYIPSAFSPNGDNKNDTFKPEGQGVKTFEMYIYDMRGSLLYSSIDINRGWEGNTIDGVRCQQGTYVYKISVIDSQNKNHTYIGVVNLIK